MNHKKIYALIAILSICLIGGCTPKPKNEKGTAVSVQSTAEAASKESAVVSPESKSKDEKKTESAAEPAKAEEKQDNRPAQKGSSDGQTDKPAENATGAGQKTESSRQQAGTSEESRNGPSEATGPEVPVVPDINVSEQDLELPDEAVFDAGEHSEPKEEAASGGETGNNPAETAEQTEGASAGGEENEDEGEMVIPNPVSAG